jgi:DNA-binding transcriptional LysR family regulator
VSEGVGLSFLPYPYIAREVKLGQVQTFGKKPLWHHDLYLVCHKDFVNQAPARELCRGFLQTCKKSGCRVTAHI